MPRLEPAEYYNDHSYLISEGQIPTPALPHLCTPSPLISGSSSTQYSWPSLSSKQGSSVLGSLRAIVRGICREEAQIRSSQASQLQKYLNPFLYDAKEFGAFKFYFMWASDWSKCSLANPSVVRTQPAPGQSTENAERLVRAACQAQPGPTLPFPLPSSSTTKIHSHEHSSHFWWYQRFCTSVWLQDSFLLTQSIFHCLGRTDSPLPVRQPWEVGQAGTWELSPVGKGGDCFCSVFWIALDLSHVLS